MATQAPAPQPPTPGALAGFVYCAQKALEVVVEVEHPPTSECLGDGVAAIGAGSLLRASCGAGATTKGSCMDAWQAWLDRITFW